MSSKAATVPWPFRATTLCTRTTADSLAAGPPLDFAKSVGAFSSTRAMTTGGLPHFTPSSSWQIGCKHAFPDFPDFWILRAPFRFSACSQKIALGALDKQPLLEFWSELLYSTVRASFESAFENVAKQSSIRRMRDARGAGSNQRSTRTRNEGTRPRRNHFGLWVDDRRQPHGWLSARGVGPPLFPPTPRRHRRAPPVRRGLRASERVARRATTSQSASSWSSCNLPPKMIAAFASLAPPSRAEQSARADRAKRNRRAESSSLPHRRLTSLDTIIIFRAWQR